MKRAAFIQLVWFTKSTGLEAPIKIFPTFSSSGESRFDLEMCQKESMDAEVREVIVMVAILIISICWLCPDSRDGKKKKKKVSCWVYYSWTQHNFWIDMGPICG